MVFKYKKEFSPAKWGDFHDPAAHQAFNDCLQNGNDLQAFGAPCFGLATFADTLREVRQFISDPIPHLIGQLLACRFVFLLEIEP